jgi:hypothetical protein
VAGYETGKTMKELAAEFGINRVTVSAHLHRANVPTRRGGLDEGRADEAGRPYQAGWSSGRLATRFGVSADTVLKAPRSANVSIRPRQGGASLGCAQPAWWDGRVSGDATRVDAASAHCAGVAGWMFLLFRNTFSGSYLAFTSTSRR